MAFPNIQQFLLAAVTLVVAGTPLFGSSQETQSFAGSWEVVVDNQDAGNSVRGVTTIREENGAFFVTAETGEIRLSGVGIRDGDNLFVGLGTWTRGIKPVGIFSYALLPGGVLDGRWFSIDGQGVGYEKGVSGGHEGLVGSYQVQGRGPANSGAYRGSLRISNRTPGYWFDWDLGTVKYRGIGVEHAGQYFSSWCITGVCILAHYKLAGDRLQASLFRSDSTITFEEQLTKASLP